MSDPTLLVNVTGTVVPVSVAVTIVLNGAKKELVFNGMNQKSINFRESENMNEVNLLRSVLNMQVCKKRRTEVMTDVVATPVLPVAGKVITPPPELVVTIPPPPLFEAVVVGLVGGAASVVEVVECD